MGTGRLVGLPAPDFEAEAVFEKKFIDVKLSDYRCSRHTISHSLPVFDVVIGVDALTNSGCSSAGCRREHQSLF